MAKRTRGACRTRVDHQVRKARVARTARIAEGRPQLPAESVDAGGDHPCYPERAERRGLS
jgi:hypothetical protein